MMLWRNAFGGGQAIPGSSILPTGWAQRQQRSLHFVARAKCPHSRPCDEPPDGSLKGTVCRLPKELQSSAVLWRRRRLQAKRSNKLNKLPKIGGSNVSLPQSLPHSHAAHILGHDNGVVPAGNRLNSTPEKSNGGCGMPIAPIRTGVGVACIEISLLLCSTTCKSRAPLVRSPVRGIYSEMLLAHD